MKNSKELMEIKTVKEFIFIDFSYSIIAYRLKLQCTIAYFLWKIVSCSFRPIWSEVIYNFLKYLIEMRCLTVQTNQKPMRQLSGLKLIFFALWYILTICETCNKTKIFNSLFFRTLKIIPLIKVQNLSHEFHNRYVNFWKWI